MLLNRSITTQLTIVFIDPTDDGELDEDNRDQECAHEEADLQRPDCVNSF
jgi:hypothetical protein